MLQETKLKTNERLSSEALKDFQVYYLSRKESQGGGIALGVTKDLESTLIREGDDQTEVMAVQVVVGELSICVINAYGPQENSIKEKKEKFWQFIEEEVCRAEIEGNGLILQMDGNLHAGPSLIKNDPNSMNQNGKLFLEFLERNPSLIVVNTLDVCRGLITRRRDLKSKTEEAVLDFFVINEKMRPFLKNMLIDENRDYCLSNYSQIRKNQRVIESDHNSEILEMDLQFSKRKPERIEMFNLKNKACQEAFKMETEDNPNLLQVFENNLPFKIQSKKWLSNFQSVLHKCFKKVRITNSKKKEADSSQSIMLERIKLQKELKIVPITEDVRKKIEVRIQQIEIAIGDEVAEKNMKEIVETIKSLGGEDHCLSGSGRKQVWKILKNKFPKIIQQVPVGKKDSAGNLITNHAGLKKLYLDTYINRLRNRPIKSDFEELKEMKTQLFNLRLKLSETRKSRPWEMKDLLKVLGSLKKDKARDPNGWLNDIFKEGVAGNDLRKSMLILFNKMRSEKFIPDFVGLADVATIYKGKGEKCSLENDRGIFLVTIFRSILMRLVYGDKYDEIDQSMSDSQVGARKRKNIRNHIWVINGIICDVLSSKKKHPVDLQIFDYKQCFDSLWLEECLNDLYTAGLDDDKFQLLYNVNSHVNVAVKTPVGKTDRGVVRNSVIQGDVFGPILCSKQVDTIGQECLDDNKYTYMYKGMVEIPPLGMVDDLICVSECGFQSAMMNSYINFKTNSKKLQFGISKCKKIHIGKVCEEYKCQNLTVDSWTETAINNQKTAEITIEDSYLGEENMVEVEEEKYLGDVISRDGKNIKNFKARVNKGTGIVNKIMNMLDGIPFGQFYFEIALILRNSLLVSSMLCNSEAWYNITNSELNFLETVDLMLLRKILNVPKTTPKEMLYLELGCIPFRNVIQQRRLSFLYYILQEDPKSLVYRFFETQRKNRTKNDWVTTILRDLEELKLNLNFDEIKAMKKSSFVNLLKQSIVKKSLEELNKKKESHSKVMGLEHKFLKMKRYFLSSNVKASKEEIQMVFKLRSRVTDLKTNFKNMYESYECTACGNEEESQKHILECRELLKRNKDIKENPVYEKIFEGNISQQINIAKIFKENMQIKEKMMKGEK